MSKEQEKQNVFPDYDPAKQWPPVCYILDEADIHFGAREYADHGRSVNFYNKQHRKLGDTPKANALARALALETAAFRQNFDSKPDEVYLTGISTIRNVYCRSSLRRSFCPNLGKISPVFGQKPRFLLAVVSRRMEFLRWNQDGMNDDIYHPNM